MNSEDLLLKIKTVLISQKIPTSPENIVKACFETILKLSQNDIKSPVIKTLFSIVIQMRYFQPEEQTLKVISRCISEYTSEVVTLLKFHFLNSNSCTNSCNNGVNSNINSVNNTNINTNNTTNSIKEILLKNLKFKSVSNLLAKHIDSIDSVYPLKNQVILIKNSLPILGNKIDVIDFINKNIIEPEDMDGLILAFLEYEYSIDGNIEISIIKDIIENKLSDNSNIINKSGEMVRIITLLLFFYKKALRSSNLNINSIISNKLLNLMKFEIFENENNSEESLLEMVSHISSFVLPGFSSLLRDLNSKFLHSDNNNNNNNINNSKLTSILRNLVSYIKIDEFIDIVEDINISKHYLLFKGISNSDISVFLDLYSKYPNDRDCILSLLPSFSYYCTDQYDNYISFINIIKSHIKTHPTIVSLTIERLIQSHRNNLQNELKLVNPISKEESLRILRGLDGILNGMMEVYMESKGNEYDCAIESLIDLLFLLEEYNSNNINIGGKMENFSSSNQITTVMFKSIMDCINNENNSSNLYNALRLLPFFVKYSYFDFDFISRLVELCSSSEIDIQKKSYHLLYCIYNKGRTDVCICDILYSSLGRTVNGPSEKNRILLQYSIIKRGCKCTSNNFNNNGSNNNNNDNTTNTNNNTNININNNNVASAVMFDKFIKEILENIITGNHKCKKAIKEILRDIVDDQFVKFLILNMNSDDSKIVSGCIEIFHFILENNLHYDEIIVRRLIEVGSHSQSVSKQVLSIFILLIKEHLDVFDQFRDDILNLVDSYISQFSKKMNSQLREFCVIAEKKGILTKVMRSFLRLKNSGGKVREIKIVKKIAFKDLL